MERPDLSPAPRAAEAVGLLALAALGYLAPAFSRALWNPDEPRVAHLALSMAQGGDRVVPRVNGRPFVQEPPLVPWLAALAFSAFGSGPGKDWVPRVPSMVFALGTILLLGLEGARLRGSRAGFLAALTLASTAEFLEVANRAGTDVAVTFFVAAGGFQLLRVAGEPRLLLSRALLFGGAVALSFLARNLLGPVYLGVALAGLLAARRDLLRDRATWTRGAAAAALALALVLPWLLLLGERDPALLRTLLWENTQGRFLSRGRHDPGLLEFAARVLADLLPWTPLLLPALWTLGRKACGRARGAEGACPAPDREAAQARVLLSWIVLPALLVAASGSKRDLYLLPLYPPLALALGLYLDRALERRAARVAALAALPLWGAAVPAMAFLGGIWVHPLPPAVFLALAVHLYLLFLWVRSRGWRSAASSAVTACLLLGLSIAAGNLLRLSALDASRSYVPLGERLRGLRAEGFRVEGYRLGLREVSAVAYYLGGSFENLEEAAAAEAALSPEGPPAALVVERIFLESGAANLGERAQDQLAFPVSRGLRVLTNRPLSPSGKR